LQEYDAFYANMRDLFDRLTAGWHSILVLDLHSYNHHRTGPNGPGGNPEDNPEINVGTGSLNRERWASVVDTFMDALRHINFQGRHLDVRENVKFRGGHFSAWLNTTYSGKVCTLAIECKKFFMDEWNATADIAAVEDLGIILRESINATRQELARERDATHG
jgi:hypothetical protein